MKQTPIIKIKTMKGIWDTDWDGVPNDRDCVWYDPNRHGIKEWKEKRSKIKEKKLDVIRKQQEKEYKKTKAEEKMHKKREKIIVSSKFYAWECKKCGRVFPPFTVSHWTEYEGRTYPSCPVCGESTNFREILLTKEGKLLYVDTLKEVPRSNQWKKKIILKAPKEVVTNYLPPGILR